MTSAGLVDARTHSTTGVARADVIRGTVSRHCMRTPATLYAANPTHSSVHAPRAARRATRSDARVGSSLAKVLMPNAMLAPSRGSSAQTKRVGSNGHMMTSAMYAARNHAVTG